MKRTNTLASLQCLGEGIFTSKHDVNVGVFTDNFDKGEEILVYLCLLRVFIKNECLFLSNYVIYCIDHVFPFLGEGVLIWCIILVDFDWLTNITFFEWTLLNYDIKSFCFATILLKFLLWIFTRKIDMYFLLVLFLLVLVLK